MNTELKQINIETNELGGDKKTIAMLESYGYKNVRRHDKKNFNDTFLATKDEIDCFIKLYNTHHGSDEINLERSRNEMICYGNLPKDFLIDLIEVNLNERYLALKYLKMDDFTEDEEMLEEFMYLGLEKFSQIDASFLQETPWKNYEELFGKIKNIEKAGYINNAEKVISIIKNNRQEIESAPKIFSHGDLNRLNVKKYQGKTRVFDFEISSRDNAMSDMAIIYIDIFNNQKLVDLFWQKIRTSPLFNERLLNLMILKRSSLVMNAYTKRNRKEKSQFFLANEKAFFEAYEKLSTK